MSFPCHRQEPVSAKCEKVKINALGGLQQALYGAGCFQGRATYENIHLFIHAIIDDKIVCHPHSVRLHRKQSYAARFLEAADLQVKLVGVTHLHGMTLPIVIVAYFTVIVVRHSVLPRHGRLLAARSGHPLHSTRRQFRGRHRNCTSSPAITATMSSTSLSRSWRF